MTDDRPARPSGIWNLNSLVGDLAHEQGLSQGPKPAPAANPVPAAAPMPVAVPAAPTPPPRSRPKRAPLVLAVMMVVVVAVTAAIAVAVRGGDPADESGPRSAGIPVASPDEAAPNGQTLIPTVPPPSGPPTTSSDAEAAALQTLVALRAQDRPIVQFDRQFVAQLASKTVGIVDPYQTAANGSHTFYTSDILAEHLSLRRGDNLGATVVLTLSTDYGRRQRYQGHALWVTFALGTFDSADTVRAWCVARFPDLTGDALVNQCTPRRLEPPHA